ncbi:hypothetical protein [Synechococcus sp. ROS8604]|uniref:hypothetical protein n=1 Tax=Synechococcus sp. ROS8604 TaxID=1442557 RepID=UPI0016493DD4|nr:hypothetical protein [Synechococcus sp. ROS8604]QNI88894.1 hypothetical protein SynROS8604_02264 [Synechococcus sp. ROS8604]
MNNDKDEQKKSRINNILGGISNSNFGQGFGQAFNLDSEDRRDALYSRREAEGKAAIPPRYQQTLSQHPLIDSVRQYASTTDNRTAANVLQRLGLGPFNDGMYSFRANNGLNVGGAPAEAQRLPDLQVNEQTGKLRQPTAEESKRIARDKQRVRDTPLMQKLGYGAGGLANDFTNNASRNAWWLINAIQAPVDLASEATVAHLNPDLYREEAVELQDAIDKGLVRYSPDYDEEAIKRAVTNRGVISEPLPNLTGEAADFGGYTREGEAADRAATERAVRDEMYSRNNAKNYKRAAPGVRVRFDKGNNRFEVRRRAYSPTLVNLASMLPAATAVNIGIGLLGGEDNGTITGRQAGYTAAVPDEIDPRKTSNALAEVGMRYFLGREGRLMDADDFLLERPDVSAAEYANYRGYLQDRGTDLNPFDDGKFNLAGILKGTDDGIRGPELQFLGKSVGLNDTGVPVATTLLGSALGALAGRRTGIRGNKPAVIGALAAGGLTGLVGGQAAGAALEDNRRRKNFEERLPGTDYDTYRENARQILDRKYEMAQANPNARAEIADSKTGFSKRNQQAALLDEALVQQTAIDQIINQESRQRALNADAKREQAMRQFNELEQSIA